MLKCAAGTPFEGWGQLYLRNRRRDAPAGRRQHQLDTPAGRRAGGMLRVSQRARVRMPAGPAARCSACHRHCALQISNVRFSSSSSTSVQWQRRPRHLPVHGNCRHLAGPVAVLHDTSLTDALLSYYRSALQRRGRLCKGGAQDALNQRRRQLYATAPLLPRQAQQRSPQRSNIGRRQVLHQHASLVVRVAQHGRQCTG